VEDVGNEDDDAEDDETEVGAREERFEEGVEGRLVLSSKVEAVTRGVAGVDGVGVDVREKAETKGVVGVGGVIEDDDDE